MTKATVNEFRKFFGYQPLEDRFGSMRIEVNFPNRHDDRIYLDGLIQKEAMMHIEQQLPQVAEQMNEIFALADREDWTIERWLRCTLDIVLESGGGPSRSGVQIGDCSRFDRCRMRLYQGDRPCNNWQLLVVKGQELLDLAIKHRVEKSIHTLERFLKIAPEMNTLQIAPEVFHCSHPQPEAQMLVVTPTGKAAETVQAIRERMRWKNAIWIERRVRFNCKIYETQLGKIRFLFVDLADIDKVRGYIPDYAIDLQAGLRTEDEQRSLGWLFCKMMPINEFMGQLASFSELVRIGAISQREAHEETSKLVQRMFKGWGDRARPSGVVVPALSQPAEGPRVNSASPSPE